MNVQLVFSGSTATDADIVDFRYTHRVNPSGQWTIGTVACAELAVVSRQSYNVGDSFTFKVKFQGNNTYTQIGVFTIKEKAFRNNVYSYFCYDNIMKFETVVDSWYNSISWSSSTDAYAIFLSLCQHIGVTGDWYFGNKNFPISNTLDAVNLQGRTVLRYLAEIAGQFCYATSTGSIKMEGFGGGVGLLDNTRYFQMTLADYQCPQVDRAICQIKPTGTDMYYQTHRTGTQGKNPLILRENYLMYDKATSDYNNWASTVFSFATAYTPFSCECYKDFGLNAGDSVLIDSGVYSIIMAKKITPSGVVFEATGSKERDETTALKSELVGYKDLTANYYSKSDWASGVQIVSSDATGAINMKYTQSGVLNEGYYRGGNLQLTQDTGTAQYSSLITANGGNGLTVTDYSSQLRVGNDSAQGFGFYGYKANPLDPDNPWIMTKYSNVDATEEWNTVGNYGGTTEPSYNNWPVVLASKKQAVKGFILELKSSSAEDANLYATTTIMAWPLGKKTSSNTDFIITAEATSGTTKAYCRINFTNYQYKVWVNDITRSAVLKCFF